jgi:hypothetical protein
MSQSTPSKYNGHQSDGGSVRNWYGKRLNGPAINTAKHPLPLKRVAPMIIFEEMKPNVYLFDKMFAY